MKPFLILLFFISITALDTWGSSYVLHAGDKKVTLDLDKTDWTDFCLKEKFGCARFQVKQTSTSSSFGFIKALSHQSTKEDFQRLCQETFDQTKKIVSDSKDFSYAGNKSISYCSWNSSKETTILSYKYGITIIISISEKSLKDSLLAMLNRTKLHEKP